MKQRLYGMCRPLLGLFVEITGNGLDQFRDGQIGPAFLKDVAYYKGFDEEISVNTL